MWLRSKSFLASLSLMLSACGSNPSGAAAAPDNFMTDANAREITSLKERVAMLEAANDSSMFKLSDEGFGFVRSSVGPVPFVWKESEKRGSGSQLTLEIGNTTNADWLRFEVYGTYGELNPDGSIKQGSTAPLTIESSTPVKSGRWNVVKIQVDGAQPEKIGFIRVNNINVSRISLLVPN